MSTSDELRKFAALPEFEEASTKELLLKAANELDLMDAKVLKDTHRLDWIQTTQPEIELVQTGPWPAHGFRVLDESGVTDVYESIRAAIDAAMEETKPEC